MPVPAATKTEGSPSTKRARTAGKKAEKEEEAPAPVEQEKATKASAKSPKKADAPVEAAAKQDSAAKRAAVRFPRRFLLMLTLHGLQMQELGSSKGKSAARPSHNLTVQQIDSDVLTRIAQSTWSEGCAIIPSLRCMANSHGVSRSAAAKFDGQVVERIYHKELVPSNFSYSRVMLLEISQYLEKFVLP